MSEQPIVVREEESSGYVKVTAVLAVILAAVAFIVPVAGVLFVIPLAIIFGAITLYGGDYKGLGLVSTILIVINLLISPTFWVNVAAGADNAANRYLTYFDVIGVLAMFVLLARRKKRTP
jgi:apolipoprotein N-acyltransferase